MLGMSPLLPRFMFVTGLLIAALNVLFAGVEYGFGNLPVWFWLAQLLLIPAMLLPARLFPQAMATRPYLRRAGLFALGWTAPYGVFKVTGDALRPNFSLDASLISLVLICAVFGLVFAAIRKPL
jgi:hypothetical protein